MKINIQFPLLGVLIHFVELSCFYRLVQISPVCTILPPVFCTCQLVLYLRLDLPPSLDAQFRVQNLILTRLLSTSNCLISRIITVFCFLCSSISLIFTFVSASCFCARHLVPHMGFFCLKSSIFVDQSCIQDSFCLLTTIIVGESRIQVHTRIYVEYSLPVSTWCV